MPHADPEERQRYNREYKRRNRWRYQRSQKSRDAMLHANQRAAKVDVPGVLSRSEVTAILEAGSCHWCGRAIGYFDTVLDHVVALSQGGPNTADNVVPSCDHCNCKKYTAPFLGRWATKYDCCQRCGTTERRHWAKGRCQRCWEHVHYGPGGRKR